MTSLDDHINNNRIREVSLLARGLVVSRVGERLAARIDDRIDIPIANRINERIQTP